MSLSFSTTASAVLKRLQPLVAMARQRGAVDPQALAPAPELVAVADVERAGALLDGAVEVRDPDLEHVERHGFGERVHLLVDHRAPVGGGDVGGPGRPAAW